jgi:hypothetical protein
MLTVPLVEFVQPLDVLLFRPNSIAGWIIAIKSWTREASHSEIVAYKNTERVVTFTARGGTSKGEDQKTGVNFYNDLADQVHRISMVLRPRDMSQARPMQAYTWALNAAVGQKYDYSGLLVFALAARQGAADKMFCSEACTRYLRHAEVDPFHPKTDADLIAPGTFKFSPYLIQYPVESGRVLVTEGC